MKSRRIDDEAVEILRDGAPDWIEVGFGAVWIADYADTARAIVRVDPTTGSVVARITVPVGAEQSMGVGERGVWVPVPNEGSVLRIDPRSNEIAAKYPLDLPSDGEGSVGVGAGAGWFVVNEGTNAGRLARVDAATGTVVARVRIDDDSHGVQFGFGCAWVTSSGAGTVTRIDPTTDAVTAVIPVKGAPRFLAIGEGAVWVLNQADGTVSRIDPLTNRVVATVSVGLPETGGDIAAGAGAVWVRRKDVLLTRIDALTNDVTCQFHPALGSGAVRVSGEDVWISAHDVQKVWRLPAR